MKKKYWLRLKQQFPIILITLLITFAFLGQTAGSYQWRFIQRLENFLYDARILLTMPGGIDERIVIIDIDEKSITEIGRWPWSRDRVARLVNELFENYGIALLGFDVVFPEPDESSGLKILEVLGKDEFADVPGYKERINGLREQLDYDHLLAQSFNGRPVILGLYFRSSEDIGQSLNSGVLPAPTFTKEDFGGRSVFARTAKGYNANLIELQKAAAGAGHFNPQIDDDGVVRRVPMVYEFEGNYYESLSLAMARSLFGVAKTEPVFAEDTPFGETGYAGLEWLKLDFLKIPVDIHVQALVPYRGYQGSFRYVSAADVLRGQVKKEVLQDKIVLVGTTAPGLFDLRTTPVQKQYAGVEIHANLIAGILDQNIKLHPAFTQGAEFIQLLITGLLLAILFPLLSPVWATFASVFMLAVSILFNLYFWQTHNMVLPLASIIAMLLCIFLVNMSYGFFIERRGKRQIASTFGQYVPPELVDEMNFDPNSYTLEAENREMTVLFSDVRGFTSLSEGLSPGELSELMNAYLTPMTAIIHEYRGTIDKYIGDAVMAFWGAPIHNPEHARYALQTGLAMLERVNALREEFKERGWPEIRIGIGINTGVMSVGNMGSKFRMAYTVLGDAVNLGSRLEGLTKSYGVEIIVSETTKEAVPDYVYRELDIVRVKGKDRPIAIYEPLAPVSEVSTEELEEIKLNREALEYYRNQSWDEAESLFMKLLDWSPDRNLYTLYLDRIAQFKHSPPGGGWDGVYTHTAK